ncbi:hypothetical protein PUN28_006739 [Cardiocondyla obscurior]|uniref:Uncharacterized protein n=1 Tax=Cardiocondyla obscurior TaxID=286306 RepID=A0AAW2G4I8_9HYME
MSRRRNDVRSEWREARGSARNRSSKSRNAREKCLHEKAHLGTPYEGRTPPLEDSRFETNILAAAPRRRIIFRSTIFLIPRRTNQSSRKHANYGSVKYYSSLVLTSYSKSFFDTANSMPTRGRIDLSILCTVEPTIERLTGFDRFASTPAISLCRRKSTATNRRRDRLRLLAP